MIKDRYSVRVDDEVIARIMAKGRIERGWLNVDIDQTGQEWVVSWDAKQPEIWKGIDK